MFVLLVGALLFAQAGNPIVTPPQNVTVTNQVTLQVPPMDPEAVSEASAVSNQSFVVNTVQPVPVEWVNSLCGLPNIWTQTPANVTYEHSGLVDLANLLLVVALGLIGLALLGAGLEIMYGADANEKLGRVGVAAALSVGNQIWWRAGIGLNNAINGVLSPADMCGSLIRPHIELARPDAGSAVAAPALVIVYAVVSLLLLVSLVFRLGMIDVLFAFGSLAMVCYASEKTENIVNWYHRIAVGTLFGQVLLCIGLRAAQATSNIGSGIAATLVSLVILLICRNLLSALTHQSVERRGSNTGRSIAVTAARLVLRFV